MLNIINISLEIIKIFNIWKVYYLTNTKKTKKVRFFWTGFIILWCRFCKILIYIYTFLRFFTSVKLYILLFYNYSSYTLNSFRKVDVKNIGCKKQRERQGVKNFSESKRNLDPSKMLKIEIYLKIKFWFFFSIMLFYLK